MEKIDFFFVRGHGKSGTTWLKNILNLHPEIECSGEFYFGKLKKSVDFLVNYRYSLICKNVGLKEYVEKEFADLFEKCILKAVNYNDKKKLKMIGDKTPGELEPFILKNKKTILIIRDGRDIMVSCAYHSLRAGGRGNDKLFPEFMDKVSIFKKDSGYFLKNKKELLSNENWFRHYAKGWALNVRNDLNTLDKIKKGVIIEKVHVVKYENLICDFEKERNKIYCFLDVDPKKALPADEITLPSFGQKREEDPNSFYRKGQAGDWKNYFIAENIKWFKEETGSILVDLGYEKNNNW